MEHSYYTHFTSPIRRAVDLFIHGLIIENKDLYKREDLQQKLDKINIFTKNCRRFSRNIRRLEFLYNLKDKNNIETYGYVIKITKNSLTLYIEEYNLEEKVIIIPRKFEHISNYEISENGMEIKYYIDDEIKIYRLYDKLNVRLWVFTSFENIFDKLKIEII
jgi:exoribonuclease R